MRGSVTSRIIRSRVWRRRDVYDPQLLALLGLPPYAGIAEIKQRFRALAKQYHPDYGGDAERFIELVGVYERLKDETR